MKKNIKLGLFVSVLCSLFYAANVSAALISEGSDVKSIIGEILKIFDSLVPILIGAALVVFLYGVFIFIAKSSAGNAEGRKEGTNFMIFGIIGLAVMMSVWGLVTFVTNTLGTTTVIPQFQTTSGSQSQPTLDSLGLPPSSSFVTGGSNFGLQPDGTYGYNPEGSLPAPTTQPGFMQPGSDIVVPPATNGAATQPSGNTTVSGGSSIPNSVYTNSNSESAPLPTGSNLVIPSATGH